MPRTLADKIAAATHKIETKSYGINAIDMSSLNGMSLEEMVHGLIGVVNKQSRLIAAQNDKIQAIDRAQRHSHK